MVPCLFQSMLLLLPLLSTASPVARATFPDPEPCTGDVQGHTHDPSVVRRDDGTYFLFTTSDKINIATAQSMNGPWKHTGSALPQGSSINLPGNQDLWAPDVFKLGSTYYLFYSVSRSGSQNSSIGVATSATLGVGSWTDHGSIGLPKDSRYNLIDANLFQHDANSPLYLTFGSYWQNIFQVTMNNPPLTYNANAGIRHIEQNTTRPAPVEGSYQFWYPVNGKDYYYLFFSSGACCNTPPNLPAPGDEYKVLVCRSTRADGGFVDKAGKDCLTQNGGTLVLGSHGDVYAPGGQGVLYDQGQKSPVLYYHYAKPSVGYNFDQFFFGWNKLDFSSGWPVVV